MKHRLREQWDKYLADVVPEDAGPAQRYDTQMAFYAGASSMLGSLMNVLGPGSEPTESDLRAMDELGQELREHLVQVVIAKAEVC